MDNKQHYFVIGGSNLQYNFVETVKNAGFVTHVFDYNPNCKCSKIADVFHCISIDAKDEILEIARKYNPVGIQTVATELGNITACYVGEKMGLNNNSYETSLNTTDKSRMKKIMLVNNIPTAKYLEVEDIKQINFADLNFPLVVKPSDRSAGRGVTLAENIDYFKKTFALAKEESFNGKVLIEEFMQGKQFSIETITCNSSHQIVAYTEEYLDGSVNFVENQQMIPARLDSSLQKELEKLILKLLNIFDIKYGCCHIEVKLTETGFKVIEIASRMGGWRDVLTKYAYGDDYNKLLLNSTLNILPIIEHKQANYALVKMVFNKKEYDFYKKIKRQTPNIIVHDEVKDKEFEEKEFINLAQAQGFYYISIPNNQDIDYYIEATIK